jgi:hypothetical protein
MSEIKEFAYDDIYIVSEMLDKMEIKSYMEYLERKLYQISKSNLPEEQMKKAKKDALSLDVMGFLVTKIHRAKPQVDRLIMSYHNLSNEELKSLGLKKSIVFFKEMLKNGLIDMIKDVVSEFKEDGTMDDIFKLGLKKTLS